MAKKKSPNKENAAAEELMQMLDRPVHLFLFVKVDEQWTEKRDNYEPFGLDFDV